MRIHFAPAAVLALALALTACSGSSNKAITQSDNGTPTPDAVGTTSAPAPGTTTAPAKATSTTSTTTSTTASAATSGSTSAATSAPTGAASSAPQATTAPGKVADTKATAPGTYTLTSSGTVTISGAPRDAGGTETLTIGKLTNGSQHSKLSSDSTGDTDEDILVRDTGSYLSSLKLTTPTQTLEFHPSPAALLVPDPATIGKTWSWSATSTDGTTKVTQSSKIVRNETLTLGGVKVPTAVISSHLVVSGSTFSYDAQLTTWWAPDYRLPVKTHTVGSGMAGGFPFKTDVTAVMKSVKPS